MDPLQSFENFRTPFRETQMAVLARGLRNEGCEVSLITFDHGQADEEIFHGVKALKSYSPAGGTRGLRGFTRAKLLWRAMRRADADIYLQMGAGSEFRNDASVFAMKFNL